MTKCTCLCAVSWSASTFWRGRVNYGSPSQTPAPPNSTFATIIVSSNQTTVNDRHFKSNEHTTPLHAKSRVSLISPSKGLEISYWLPWFTQTITCTSIPPIRARRPAPYAVVMRCFKESHLHEETGLERNGTALLTDVHLLQTVGKKAPRLAHSTELRRAILKHKPLLAHIKITFLMISCERVM